MKWFGKSWGAPICDDSQNVRTPEGEICPECGEPIKTGQQGFILPYTHTNTVGEVGWVDNLSYHLDCFLKTLGIK
jgi:hypothetical protein